MDLTFENTWRWYGPNDPVSLIDIKQAGATGIVTALHHIPNGTVWPLEEIKKRKKIIEANGLSWSVVESVPVHEAIKTQRGDFKTFIENYKATIGNLAACGIDTICYNFMPVLDWARTDLHYLYENGAESMLYDHETFAAFDIFILERPDAEGDYPSHVVDKARQIFEGMSEEEQNTLAYNIIVVTQGFINGTVGNVSNYKQIFLDYLSRYDHINRDTLRTHLSRFLEDVLPVAEECGINMCIHPDDPPFPLLGLPRIASTAEDFAWIFNEHPSLNNGLTYCSCSLSVREDNDLVEIARTFAERVHFVHLRNIKRVGERSFYESAHLDGVANMYGILKVLLEEQHRRVAVERKDTRMPFRPDH